MNVECEWSLEGRRRPFRHEKARQTRVGAAQQYLRYNEEVLQKGLSRAEIPRLSNQDRRGALTRPHLVPQDSIDQDRAGASLRLYGYELGHRWNVKWHRANATQWCQTHRGVHGE